MQPRVLGLEVVDEPVAHLKGQGIPIVEMLIALVVGTLGTLVGSAITGLDPVWNVSVDGFLSFTLGSVLGMMFGFTLGVLIRNSAGAIVAYFVYTLVLPPLLGLLAMSLGAAEPSSPAVLKIVSFEVAQDAEVVASVNASCAGCDWGRAGHEAAVLRLELDGAYAQHLFLTRGAEAAEYRLYWPRLLSSVVGSQPTGLRPFSKNSQPDAPFSKPSFSRP